jgi:flagellar hook-associated protein 3 FlgL
MRVSTSQFLRQAVGAMQDNQARLARTELQVATGRAILTPSDDPAGAKRILDLKQVIEVQRQYQRNADSATSRLSLEESTLAGVSEGLIRVRELAIQAANSTLSPSDRRAIAAEVEVRLDELIGFANTRDAQGEYLFAGSRTDTLPFGRRFDHTVVYAGDQEVRRTQVGATSQVASGDSGYEVFQAIRNGNGTFVTGAGAGNGGSGVIDAGSVTDPSAYTGETYTITFSSPTTYDVTGSVSGPVVHGAAYTDGATLPLPGLQVGIRGTPSAGDTFTVAPSTHQDLFATVQGFLDALRADDGTAAGETRFQNALGRALTDLDQGLENIGRVRATIGARLNRVEAEKNIAADFELFAREDLSKVEDLDYAEAAGRLQLQLTVLQASQQAFVRVQGLSLFNFL